MKRYNKNIKTSVVRAALTLVTAMVAMACGPEFEDGTMALLKKPEILSIVLDSPEAAPGEQVTASFLIADDKGVIEGKAALWMPAEEAMDSMNLTMDDLAGETLAFTVPSSEMFYFNEDGFSSLPLALAAAHGNSPAPDSSAEELFAGLEQYIDTGAMKMAMRTLMVSQRENPNENPHVLSLHSGPEETQGTELTIVRSDDEDIAAARQAAADNPLVLEAESEIWFAVEVEDDGDVEETVRYQWISTGGDFFGFRDKVEEWEVPEYKELSTGEQDQTGLTNVDPRTDPNLHSVWLIVRDDLADNQLGQTWAEFYVRVVPST